MKERKMDATEAERVAAIDTLIDKNELKADGLDYVKVKIALTALQTMGFGRNESTINVLRFIADLFESEVPLGGEELFYGPSTDTVQ